MEMAGIRRVTDRTVRRLLNRKGYFFLQARKKKDWWVKRTKWKESNLLKRCKKLTRRLFGPKLLRFIWMESPSFTRRTPWINRELPKGEYGEKNPKVSNKGAWLRGVKLEREEDGNNKVTVKACWLVKDTKKMMMLWLVVTPKFWKYRHEVQTLILLRTFFTLYLAGSWKKMQLIRELHVSHIKSSAVECGEQSIVFLTSWSIKV